MRQSNLSGRQTAALLSVAFLCSGLPVLATKQTKEKVFAEAKPNQALVYVLRKGRFAGGGRTLFVYADDKMLAVLDNGSYAFQYIDPGRYLVWTNWTRMRREVDFVAGKVHYVDPWMPIKVLSEEEGKALLEKIESHATPTEDELRTVAQQLKDRYAKAQRREAKVEKGEFEDVAALPRPVDTSGMLRVPGSTEVSLELMENVTSYMSAVGDPVWFRVSNAVVVEGHAVIAAGTPARGVLRKREKAAMAGAAGSFDIVVPWLEASDGGKVPLLGRLDATGRHRRAAATATMATTAVATTLASGGLFYIGVAFNRGKEAFLLRGEEYHVWTREDHWASRMFETEAPGIVEWGETSSIKLPARVSRPVEFAPQKHRQLDDISIVVETESELSDVEVFSISGSELLEPVSPKTSSRVGRTVTLTFGGWDLVRYMSFEDDETRVPIGVRGYTFDKTPFVADGEIAVAVKLPSRPK